MKSASFIPHEYLMWAGISVLALVALGAQVVGRTGVGPDDDGSGRAFVRVAPATADEPRATPDALMQDPEDIEDLLVEAVIQIESGGRADSVGRHGERGLMQIRAATWREVTRRLFGGARPFEQAFDPETNRQVGSAYLEDIGRYLDRHRPRWKSDRRSLLLACYNAGPSRVYRAGFDLARVPASTRDYVARIGALHDQLLVDARMPRLARATPPGAEPKGS